MQNLIENKTVVDRILLESVEPEPRAKQITPSPITLLQFCIPEDFRMAAKNMRKK